MLTLEQYLICSTQGDEQANGSSKESCTTSCFSEMKKENGLVTVSHRIFAEVFVSGNKKLLVWDDVPGISIY